MCAALEDLWQTAEGRGLPLRTAATVLGVDRIAKAVEERAHARTSALVS